jgi:hypothetical protein
VSNLREQGLPAEDLSDLSAPAARGKGLAGLVGNTPASPRPEPQQSVAVEEDSRRDAAEPAASSASRVGDATSLRRKPGPGRPRTRVKPTSAVYVSSGVKQRFEAYRHRSKATNLQVVLEAISSLHGELKDIIADSTFNTAPVNPLFPADPSAVRYVGGGSVQIGFSPTADQEEVLDRIGADLGFETRSTWIAPVLNAFLPGRKDSPPAR